MLRKYLLLIILSFYSVISVSAIDKEIEFANNYTISDGLAHNGVTSILEDSRGYIWSSSYDGLNRYDGYEFKSFRNTLNKTLFSSNRIRTLMEDRNGNIWIGTDEGVSIYYYQNQQFKMISLKGLEKEYATNRPEIRQFIENKEAGVIVCTTENGGILVFNDDYTFDSPYIPSIKLHSRLQGVMFYEGIVLDADNYLFSTNAGLLEFNLDTKEFRKVLKGEVWSSLSLKKFKDDKFLLCSFHGVSIVEFIKSNGTYTYNVVGSAFEDIDFSCSLVGEDNTVWLGSTKMGLGIKVNNIDSILDPSYPHVYFLNKPDNIVKPSCFFHSSSKGSWMGTFNKGIYRYSSKENPFKEYRPDMNQKYGMKSGEIYSYGIYDRDRVYLVTRTSGIYLFNTKTRQFEPLPFNINEDLRLLVKAVFVDAKGNTWLRIRGYNNIFRVRPGMKEIEKELVQFDPSFINAGIRDFSQDNDGNIWIVAIRNVYRLKMDVNNNVEKLEMLISHPFFRKKRLFAYRNVYTDPTYDFIWIGSSSEGLFRLDFTNATSLNETIVTQYVVHPDVKGSIPNNAVTSLLRLPNDDLWMGTEGGGVCKVLNSDDKPFFVPFTEDDGLSNNVVKGLLLDKEKNLWVTTNIGLNKFVPAENRFTKYRIAEGLPFEDFWYPGVCLKSGVLVISGMENFTYFNSKDLPSSEKLPRIEFGDLKLFNASVLPGDTINKRILLNRRLDDVEEVTLKHNENVFSIELKSLHFSTHANHFIKYQLLPVNEDWVKVPASQRYVHNNGLPPGEYTLRFCGSNSFNEWTEPKELKITIEPPFWKTWYAIVAYVIMLSLAVYLVFLFFHKVNKLRHELEIEHLEKDNEKNVNVAKLRFFSNISHEIKTPLTLISGPVNLLVDRYRGNVEITDKLHLVQRQTKKISQLIDQVHDFQRSEAKLLDMNYSSFSFDEFINELVVDFKFLAQTDHKELEVMGKNSGVFVHADKDKLEKVFNNLLNNAFKFTKAGDKISITYVIEGKKVFVSVVDSGRGIDLSDLPHIFERFYQSKKKHGAYTGGSGIGLAFSKRLVEMHYGSIDAKSVIGEGTEIKVELPIVKELAEGESIIEKQVLEADKNFDLKEESKVEDIDVSNIVIDKDVLGLRVFFAEDNTDMRVFVSNILSGFFEVKAFENGQVLLDAMKEEWPDIVVSDVLMPEINGFELCKTVKTDIKTSHIPVVLLTACTAIDDQIQGLAEGADAYIQKPFNTHHLLSTIEAVLKNRKQLRERFQIEIPLNLNKTKSGDEDSIFIEKLYALMDENLDNQQVDFNDMARQLYLNRTHFYQKVKAITNQTPFELIRMYRITKAGEFLSKDNLSVNEVFLMTGFKSRSHFTKLFKEKYHVTPGKFASEALKDFKEK